MKRTLAIQLQIAFLVTLMPCVALSDPTPMPLDQIGVGAHGYDFMIGRWRCTYTSKTDKYSSRMFIYAHRSDLTNSLELDWQAPGVRTVERLRFDPKNGWSGTIVDLEADYLGFSVISTSDVGQVSVWTGPLSSAQGALYAATSNAAPQIKPDDPRPAVEPVHPEPLEQQGHDLMRWTWIFPSSRELNNSIEELRNGVWNATAVVECMKM